MAIDNIRFEMNYILLFWRSSRKYAVSTNVSKRKYYRYYKNLALVCLITDNWIVQASWFAYKLHFQKNLTHWCKVHYPFCVVVSSNITRFHMFYDLLATLYPSTIASDIKNNDQRFTNWYRHHLSRHVCSQIFIRHIYYYLDTFVNTRFVQLY